MSGHELAIPFYFGISAIIDTGGSRESDSVGPEAGCGASLLSIQQAVAVTRLSHHGPIRNSSRRNAIGIISSGTPERRVLSQ